MSGRSGPNCKCRAVNATSRCSIWRSTASCMAGDIVAVRVDDVAPSGYAMDRATIRQRKTGRPVRFELTDHSRLAIDKYMRATGRKPGQMLFAGRGDGLRGLTTGHSISGFVTERRRVVCLSTKETDHDDHAPTGESVMCLPSTPVSISWSVTGGQHQDN